MPFNLEAFRILDDANDDDDDNDVVLISKVDDWLFVLVTALPISTNGVPSSPPSSGEFSFVFELCVYDANLHLEKF